MDHGVVAARLGGLDVLGHAPEDLVQGGLAAGGLGHPLGQLLVARPGDELGELAGVEFVQAVAGRGFAHLRILHVFLTIGRKTLP